MNNPRVIYEFGDFALEVGRQTLMRRDGSDAKPLTAKVFDTLVYFVEHAGEALDKDTLLSVIWPDVVVEENSLTQIISTLRQMLGETRGDNCYIVTLPRKGYRFVASVTKRSSEATLTAPVSAPAQAEARPLKHRRWIGVAAITVLLLVSAAIFLIFRENHAPTSAHVQALAILPFKPLLASDRNESLELGMTDSLIASLSGRGDQLVHPLSSVRRYASVDQNAIAAGRELQADVVLDGSIQRQGDRLRVAVRLLRVADGKQLWSKNFDQQFTDIFAVQDAIALGIAKELPQWRTDERKPHRYTKSAEAYANYASGQYLWARYTEPALVQALGFFEKAIALDPNYAAAYVGIADSYAIMGVFAMRSPHDVYPRAQQAVDKALSIDPQLGPAYATRGQIKVQYHHDWDGATRDFARAVELDPNHARTYTSRGMLLAGNGQAEEGLAQIRRAQEIEPFALSIRAQACAVLIYMGRIDEAIAQLREVLTLDDRADSARGFLIRALIVKGDYEQALKEIPERQLQVPLGYAYRGQALALSGRRAEARAEINRLLELSKKRFVPSMDLAIIYAALGDNDLAFAALERSIEERSTHTAFIAQSPMLESLRGDPRFDAMVKKIGVYGRPLPQ